MLKSIIVNANKGFSLSDNKNFINVHFNVMDGKELVGERVLAFKLDATKEEILAELDKQCIMIENDIASVKEAEKRSEAEKAADETIEQLIK